MMLETTSPTGLRRLFLNRQNVEVCMYQTFRLIITATALAFGSFAASAPADAETMQIKLTDQQVAGFIAAQKDLSAALERMQAAVVFSDQDNIKHRAEFERIVKRQGFKNFADYELVASNISLVMTAMDPQTRAFSDPHTAIEKEIESVRTDNKLSDRTKKELLLELKEALKATQPIEFPTNIELVRKYYEKIDLTIIAAYDSEGRSNSPLVRTISE
jgi:hypothetical protein